MKKENNKSMKIIALIVLAIAVIILMIVFLTRQKEDAPGNNKQENNTVKEEFVQVLDDGTKVNVSTKLKETKKIGDLSIGNIKYTYRNGISSVSAEVTNNADKASDLKDIKLTLLDKNNEVMAELEGLIAPIEPGEKTKLTLSVTLDLVNAYDFTIEEM